jgi:hypothetical protein
MTKYKTTHIHKLCVGHVNFPVPHSPRENKNCAKSERKGKMPGIIKL